MSHPTRRNLLKLATAASALAATGSIPALVENAFADETPTAAAGTPVPFKALPWKNWSGGQHCNPAARAAPASVDELASLIAKTPLPVRGVGAGHSFSALVPTDGTIITLDRIAGVENANLETGEADVWAGTRLAHMGDELAKLGLAFANMPDINKQSLAGAIATSTHGTGAGIGSLSTFMLELDIVTADGKVVTCSATKNADLYQAARVSVGSLGIITKARVKAQPVYKLKRKVWVEPIEDMLDKLPGYESGNRNFEFYYVPFSGLAMGISNNETDEPETPAPLNEDDNALRQLKILQDWLGWSPTARRWIG